MDEGIVVTIVTLTVVAAIGVFSLVSVRDTRACKMEAAAKGYNVKEICE